MMYTKTYSKEGAQLGPVSFQRMSSNRKLSPAGKHGTSSGPYCSSTYVSITATCPKACPFKDNGCYAQSGHTGIMVKRLDREAKLYKPTQVSRLEAALIKSQWEGEEIPQDGINGGRDLRLHVAGDAPTNTGAKALASAANDWTKRGGGSVWTYTHNWRAIDRKSWGSINVFASVETLKEAKQANKLGYHPAITVNHHENDRAWNVKNSKLKVIPCPAQTRGRTCVECRLCLDRTPDNAVIAFAVHGSSASKAKKRLPLVASKS